jgi:cytochrome c biogenesis protein CcdA
VIDLAVFVVSVALVDSLNPTTIVPALYLGTGPKATRAVLGFAAGLFAVNLAAGVALLLLGNGIANHLPHPSQCLIHSGEIALGIVLIAVAIVTWIHRHRVAGGLSRIDSGGHRFAPLGGATIAAVELPTAFPYFAVVAAIAASGQSAAYQVAMIVLFNLLFLAPVLTIAVVRLLAGDRAVEFLTQARTLVLRHAGSVMAVVFLGLGIVLICVGAVGLAG